MGVEIDVRVRVVPKRTYDRFHPKTAKEQYKQAAVSVDERPDWVTRN